MGWTLAGDLMSAQQHPSHGRGMPGLPTVMLVMLGTGQIGVPPTHRLGGRRSGTLARFYGFMELAAGFMEQALFLGGMTGTYWGWHRADDGQGPVTHCWLCGPVPIYC